MSPALPSYYVDGYALYALLQGKPGFNGFSKAAIITSYLDLQLLHGLVLKSHGNDIADEMFEQFLPYAVSIPKEAFKEANNSATQKISAQELLGWLTARSRGITYLTADARFKGKAGVILR